MFPRRFPLQWVVVCAMALFLNPLSAFAQSSSAPQGPPLEPRWLDAAVGVWMSPCIDVIAKANYPDIPGTEIDYREDLGLTDRSFLTMDFTARFAAKHKIRFQYSPIRYETPTTTLSEDIVFRGGLFPAGTDVVSTLTWEAYHIGYEYDVLVRPWGFIGVLAEVYRTDVQLRMISATDDRLAPSSVPTLPTIGAVARVYVTDRVSLTAEFSGLKIPDKEDEEYGGHLYDLEVYGMVRATRHLGAQFGYRLLDIRHLGNSDTGTMKLKGFFATAVISY